MRSRFSIWVWCIPKLISVFVSLVISTYWWETLWFATIELLCGLPPTGMYFWNRNQWSFGDDKSGYIICEKWWQIYLDWRHQKWLALLRLPTTAAAAAVVEVAIILETGAAQLSAPSLQLPLLHSIFNTFGLVHLLVVFFQALPAAARRACCLLPSLLKYYYLTGYACPPRLLRVSCPASAQCSAGSLVLKSLTKFCSTGISKSGFFWPFESKLLWVQNLSGSLSLVYAGAAMVSDPVYSSLDEDGSSMTATVWVFDLLHPVGNGWLEPCA